MVEFNPDLLRHLRKQASFTIAELADAIGISTTQLHRLEKGQRRLTVDMLLQISHALGVNASSLLAQEIRVPVIGLVDAADDVLPLPANALEWTRAPNLVSDMENVAAVRWEPKQPIEWMFGHLLFFYLHDNDVPDVAWGKRCLITMDDGTQRIGWPIRKNGATHIDSANGHSAFNVEIDWASPILAVVPPYLIEQLTTRSPAASD